MGKKEITNRDGVRERGNQRGKGPYRAALTSLEGNAERESEKWCKQPAGELPPIISQTHLAVSQQPELSSVATEVKAGNRTVYPFPRFWSWPFTESQS